jgi:hypothetical protein
MCKYRLFRGLFHTLSKDAGCKWTLNGLTACTLVFLVFQRTASLWWQSAALTSLCLKICLEFYQNVKLECETYV